MKGSELGCRVGAAAALNSNHAPVLERKLAVWAHREVALASKEVLFARPRSDVGPKLGDELGKLQVVTCLAFARQARARDSEERCSSLTKMNNANRLNF